MPVGVIYAPRAVCPSTPGAKTETKDRRGSQDVPVVGDLVHIILNLLIHRRLLVRQPLQLAPHDPRVILQEPLPRLDVPGTQPQHLVIQNVLLFGVLHLGVPVGPLLGRLVAPAAVEVVELFEGGHLCGGIFLSALDWGCGCRWRVGEIGRGRWLGRWWMAMFGGEVEVEARSLRSSSRQLGAALQALTKRRVAPGGQVKEVAYIITNNNL